MAYTLTERLWYTANKDKAVPEGDLLAATLIGNAGTVMSDEEATRLGLNKPAAAKKKPPSSNKSRTPASNKGK